MTIRAERKFRKIFIPQLHPVLMAGLSRANVQDDGHWLSAKVAARLMTPGALDDGGREFLTWCRSPDSGLSVVDGKWHELYLWGASAIAEADRNAEQMWDDKMDSVFTHFELFSHVCRLPEHAQFRRFVASRHDPIWGHIWPPNDWLCGCTVIAIMECEVSAEDNAAVPGDSRLDPKFVARALNWYQRSPRESLKVLSTGQEPSSRRRSKK